MPPPEPDAASSCRAEDDDACVLQKVVGPSGGAARSMHQSHGNVELRAAVETIERLQRRVRLASRLRLPSRAALRTLTPHSH